MANYFKAVAAMSQNRVIGCGDRVPWRIPEDLQWFKKLTVGQVIVMGRKTFQAIGKALPDRTTIIVSRSARPIDGVRIVRSLSEIDPAHESREVFICGGAQIYAQALAQCSDLYLTLVKRVVPGDVFFPPFEGQFVAVETILDRPEFRITHYRNKALT
jgi:dihydrofolate reductase